LFFFSFLFLLTTKVHHCLFCCLIFNFSHHSFNFLFRSYSLYRFFFQFSHSITISYVFYFSFQSLFF
jgi:hypothetical protein